MTAAFSSSDTAALEREVLLETSHNWTLENVWDETQKNTCIEWVNKNKFSKVCLQFPDYHLTFSTTILEELKSHCPGVHFFILADTSYGSCCVDEIAAAHVQADSLIHFGNSCQSKVTRLPVFYIFPHFDFDLEHFSNCVLDVKRDATLKTIAIYFEPGYHHVIDDASKLGELEKLKTCETEDAQVTLEKYIGSIPLEQNVKDACVFVGRDDQTFFNICMSLQASNWYLYNPEECTMTKTDPTTTQWIKRRFFYIAKCKEAQTIGLVVATLTADGYLDVVKRIQDMAKARSKRTYIISVGRIDPPKLANFMEIDCFVLIGCPFNDLFTSRDFYKPMVSVFEAELALNPAWQSKLPELYSFNFKDILPDGKHYQEFRPENIEESDVSLLSGNMLRGRLETNSDEATTNGQSYALMEQNNMQLMEINSATTFDNRWYGLQQNLGLTEPAKITKGLSGIPTKYTHD